MKDYQLFYILACVYNAPYVGNKGGLILASVFFAIAIATYIREKLK